MNTPTPNPDTWPLYWLFTVERMRIFWKRHARIAAPWTTDPVLGEWSFTNCYRVLDRTSQALLQVQATTPDPTAQELFFRTMLFKLFNSISTWNLLARHTTGLDTGPTWGTYDPTLVRKVMDGLKADGTRLYSGAYIMQPAMGWGTRTKHHNHLHMLEQMMLDDMPTRVAAAATMGDVYTLLKRYHSVGPFLAYQYATDLNYSGLTRHSEMGFTKAGPGARDGINKCFSDRGGLTHEDIIRWTTDQQHAQLASASNGTWRNLWGRPLQLIDVQNLYCEVGKYLRVARGLGGTYGTTIKRRYHHSLRTPTANVPAWWPQQPTE